MECFRVEDIMEILDISKSSAYKLMRELNDELKSKGYKVYSGRLSKKYFYERTYGGTTKASKNAKAS